MTVCRSTRCGRSAALSKSSRRKARRILAALRQRLFAPMPPAPREPTGELTFFSAPGEAREATEIARRIVEESRRGVRFDEMAIFVRSPKDYMGLLEHALRRAQPPQPHESADRRRAAQIRRRGHPRVLRPRHPPSPSLRPGVPRDPRLRGREAVRHAVSRSTCRSGKCRSSTAGTSAQASVSEWVPPDDEVLTAPRSVLEPQEPKSLQAPEPRDPKTPETLTTAPSSKARCARPGSGST